MSRFSQDLDRHITGNWGEDQFPKCEGCHKGDQDYIAHKGRLYIYICQSCRIVFIADGYKITKNQTED